MAYPQQRDQDGAKNLFPHRLDGHLVDLLMKPAEKPTLPPTDGTRTLPDPVFPQHREPNGDASYELLSAKDKAIRAFRCWAVPYFQSRVRREPFRPILSYLFTEWKCNLDCHYCWAFNNSVKGMTEETARRSVDWLHSTGCRVLALMGGEPLLRPQFIHKIADYAAKKGFYVYVPTNGRLMRPEVIDRLGDAGVAVFNLAVDCVDEKPGLPKALTPIRPYFDHLVRMQRRYGYLVFLNINVCRTNLDDVKELTEIGRANNIATDYHINETPMVEEQHFKHLDENSTFLRPEDYPRVDEALDHLIAKSRQGYKMVNSRHHLAEMKNWMRGKVEPWSCRAGQNSLIIRVDGTLAPCFPMYSATYDWGTIEDPRFEARQLDEMKTSCTRHCFSTLNYTLGHCYNDARVLRWIGKQALRGFRGVTGAVE